MGFIYFAGESLACLNDTRALVNLHGLIWRAEAQSPPLRVGSRLLLAFWRRLLVAPNNDTGVAVKSAPPLCGPACEDREPRKSTGRGLARIFRLIGVGGTHAESEQANSSTAGTCLVLPRATG